MIIWVALAVIWVLVLAGSLVAMSQPQSRTTATLTAVGVTIAFVVVSLFFTVSKVDAGYVGLVKQFGAYQEGTKDAGAVMHWPWQQIQSARIRNASHEVRMDNPKGGPDGPAGSSESQPVFVVATLNYSLEKQCVRDLYINYGASYYDTAIEPRVKQIFKAETALYKSIAIVPSREKIRRETQKTLAAQLRKFCVVAVDFLLKNIGFDPEFEKAIVDKQVATQQAAAEENRVAIAKFQADQVAATADGQARATVRIAKADAQANRLRGKNLTPQLVEWERIQRWQPDVIYLPSSSIPVIKGVGK